jgi:SEC-C motif-containing protein
MSNDCPCASGREYPECCEPFLLGQTRPPTAAALMRARYTAYALGAIDYLYKTSGTRVRKEFDAENSRKWADSAEWTGLEIVATENGQEHDETGMVEFVAHYKIKENTFNHHERAQFARQNGVWTFMDGKIIGPGPKRRDEPKIGRNDPCPCGSGQKFKKCCALKPSAAEAEAT